MTMPNRCSSLYSPIEQFALLFCTKNWHGFTCSSTWDSNSPEGKKASVYSLSSCQGKNWEGFMFWWFCAGFFKKKITCSAAPHGILIHHQGKKAISYSLSSSHFPTPWNEHHDLVHREWMHDYRTWTLSKSTLLIKAHFHNLLKILFF